MNASGERLQIRLRPKLLRSRAPCGVELPTDFTDRPHTSPHQLRLSFKNIKWRRLCLRSVVSLLCCFNVSSPPLSFCPSLSQGSSDVPYRSCLRYWRTNIWLKADTRALDKIIDRGWRRLNPMMKITVAIKKDSVLPREREPTGRFKVGDFLFFFGN